MIICPVFVIEVGARRLTSLNNALLKQRCPYLVMGVISRAFTQTIRVERLHKFCRFTFIGLDPVIQF